MKRVYLALFITLLFLLPSAALANDFNRYSGHSSYNNRINLYHYDGDRRTYRSSGPSLDTRDWGSGCFPHGCGGISGPFKNPNPEARKPENLTACIYDITDTLVYERENKVCPYQYVDQNQSRVERRRQEWFKTQTR